MNIEKGELFVVTRGFVYDDSLAREMDAFLGIPQPATKVQHSDRSHEGCVYKALEVCGPMISAECIFHDQAMPIYTKVGRKLSINTNEVEIWPVTQKYLESLQHKDKPC